MVVSENGRVQRGSLRVAQDLDKLVREEILPGTEVELEIFWRGLETVSYTHLTLPTNREV